MRLRRFAAVPNCMEGNDTGMCREHMRVVLDLFSFGVGDDASEFGAIKIHLARATTLGNTLTRRCLIEKLGAAPREQGPGGLGKSRVIGGRV